MTQEKQEKIFIDGMRFEAPHENAPDFVKGKISIKIDKLIEFLEANRTPSGWLNVDLKESQKGVLYLELNTYQKGKKGFDVKKRIEDVVAQEEVSEITAPLQDQNEEDVGEIPF